MSLFFRRDKSRSCVAGAPVPSKNKDMYFSWSTTNPIKVGVSEEGRGGEYK